MVHQIATQLLRRSFEAAGPNFDGPFNGSWNGTWDDFQRNFDAKSIPVFVFTTLLFSLMLLSVSYTVGQVVPTLAMIETPQTAILVREPTSDYKDADALIEDLVEPEAVMIKQAPITSRIRKTIRHLTTLGGRRGRWRGATMAIMINLASGLFMSIFTLMIGPQRFSLNSGITLFGSFVPFLNILISALLARESMAWTHIVMTVPTKRRWYNRIPPLSTYKHIVWPTIVFAAAVEFQPVPAMAVATLMMNGFRDTPAESQAVATYSYLFVGAIAYFMTFVCIFIPALVSLVRCQASLLPENEETIIPFDRTFGGRVAAGLRIGYWDAWRTFDMPARMNLLRTYVKYVVIQGALVFMFVFALGMELAYFADVDLLSMAADPKAAIQAVHAGLKM